MALGSERLRGSHLGGGMRKVYLRQKKQHKQRLRGSQELGKVRELGGEPVCRECDSPKELILQ